MRSKLIIDGNAVYEIDEDCMMKKNRKKSYDTERDFGEQEDERKEKSRKKTDAGMSGLPVE